jgi:hypothetical protein
LKADATANVVILLKEQGIFYDLKRKDYRLRGNDAQGLSRFFAVRSKLLQFFTALAHLPACRARMQLCFWFSSM